MRSYDILIIGGGLVGGSLAVALGRSGLNVALVEARAAVAPAADRGWDTRVYAISPGSIRFLEQAGIWQRVDSGRVAAVRRMQVTGDDGRSQISFTAEEARAPLLAAIVENAELQAAVAASLDAFPLIDVLCPARCASIDWHDDRADVVLDSGETLSAGLVVAADGARSWVRDAAGIAAPGRGYDQSGVVANFRTERPHDDTAMQWFFRDGVLAWLPLPGRRISIVWSAAEPLAQELLALPRHEFERRVAGAGGHALGRLEQIGDAAAFPLQLLCAERMVAPRLALVGDAAHCFHPLAGQGVNVGFQDAMVLAETLAARGANPDVGDYRLLRRYERARREDVFAMQTVTDGLQRLFNNDNELLAVLRNTGLALTDRLTPIKTALIQRALA